MTSAARIEANRRNAQKSTGPRTAEGKAASRRNAVRHGLAAEAGALPTGLAEAVEAKLAAWRAEWRPSTEVEDTLLRELVTTTVQLEAAHRVESAHAVGLRRRAELAWDDDRQAETEALAARLGAQPALVASRLRGSARGCLWLAERWDGLALAAEAGAGWTDDELGRALDLLGVASESRPWHELHESAGEPEALAAFAREQSDALLDRAEAGLLALDAEDRRRAASGLAFDPTPEGRRLRGYRQALASRFDRLFAAWTALRGPRPAQHGPAGPAGDSGPIADGPDPSPGHPAVATTAADAGQPAPAIGNEPNGARIAPTGNEPNAAPARRPTAASDGPNSPGAVAWSGLPETMLRGRIRDQPAPEAQGRAPSRHSGSSACGFGS